MANLKGVIITAIVSGLAGAVISGKIVHEYSKPKSAHVMPKEYLKIINGFGEKYDLEKYPLPRSQGDWLSEEYFTEEERKEFLNR